MVLLFTITKAITLKVRLFYTKEYFMQMTITGKGFLRGLGWVSAILFWLSFLLIIASLFTTPGDSGTGMVVMGLELVAIRTFPLLFVPMGVIIYGVRKEREASLWRVLFKWGTLAAAVYLVLLIGSLLFMIR